MESVNLPLPSAPSFERRINEKKEPILVITQWLRGWLGLIWSGRSGEKVWCLAGIRTPYRPSRSLASVPMTSCLLRLTVSSVWLLKDVFLIYKLHIYIYIYIYTLVRFLSRWTVDIFPIFLVLPVKLPDTTSHSSTDPPTDSSFDIFPIYCPLIQPFGTVWLVELLRASLNKQ